jgi:cytochrome c-type biogenesis protein CcmH/NrfG
LSHARRAVELDGSSVRAWAVLAEALAATGARDEALAATGKAHTIAPADPHIHALRDRIAKPEHPRSSWIDKLLKR